MTRSASDAASYILLVAMGTLVAVDGPQPWPAVCLVSAAVVFFGGRLAASRRESDRQRRPARVARSRDVRTPVKRIVGGGSLLLIAGSAAFVNGIMYDRPWLSVIGGLLTVATLGAIARWSRAEAKRLREREPEDDVA